MKRGNSILAERRFRMRYFLPKTICQLFLRQWILRKNLDRG